MSRIGKQPITLPEGVELSVNGQDVKAKGKLGQLELRVHDEVSIKIEDVANDDGKTDKVVTLAPKSNSRFARQIWPTMRTLVNNIVVGVSEGYTKKLEIKGVGYRGNLQGKTLVLSLGFSHEVRYDIPEYVTVKMEDAAGKGSQTDIQISGIDKQQVGQVAAKIRGFKPPEPYKGKGIRYADEYVIRKEGKKK
ncbi:MAG TPA: 50S ribosomal protein L6 [Alphaproteobacteria bacterium]|nr:50S ribosomal protein L6 [Alphaproteobacteria bacterium]USO04935.1 MAG: 50S ribosomal protein L6 [Rhodospirillales bacterium]HOO81554.1 50S ribosomal protein L6 [Alphaproteobacteria bacterium]